jgi:AcrR family transcriptional regulator
LTSAQATRRERQAQTREALLQAAAKLFCREGLEGSSIDRVAQEAGYTKGAFYANFGSKEELFMVMLDERFEAQIDRLDGMLSGDRRPGDEAHDAAEDFLRFVHADPEWPRLYFEFAAYAARNDDFREQLATRQRALRERIVEIYRRWSAGFPADPPLPLADIAAMTSAMADGFMLKQLIDTSLGDELYPAMLGIFFRGLQATAVGWEPPALEGALRADGDRASARPPASG